MKLVNTLDFDSSIRRFKSCRRSHYGDSCLSKGEGTPYQIKCRVGTNELQGEGQRLIIYLGVVQFSRTPVLGTGGRRSEAYHPDQDSHMRNGLVEKNAEAQTSHLQVVLCGATQGRDSRLVDSKRIPTNYQKHTALLTMVTPCEKGWLKIGERIVHRKMRGAPWTHGGA